MGGIRPACCSPHRRGAEEGGPRAPARKHGTVRNTASLGRGSLCRGSTSLPGREAQRRGESTRLRGRISTSGTCSLILRKKRLCGLQCPRWEKWGSRPCSRTFCLPVTITVQQDVLRRVNGDRGTPRGQVPAASRWPSERALGWHKSMRKQRVRAAKFPLDSRNDSNFPFSFGKCTCACILLVYDP